MALKTITYNTETHKVVPLEPTEEMLDILEMSIDTAEMYDVLVKTAPEYEGLPPSALTEWLKTQPQTVGNVEQNDD